MKFPAMTTSKPELQREHLYLEELARRVQAVLGDELVGVYAGGSFALGGYEPSRSDLDVAVVIESPLAEEQRHLLVERVSTRRFPARLANWSSSLTSFRPCAPDRRRAISS